LNVQSVCNGVAGFEKYLTTTATDNPKSQLLSISPAVTTGSVSSLAPTSVTLNGTVNANGASATVSFEHGATTAYGTTVAASQSPVTGTTGTSVSVGITSLSANTQYNFRVSATNVSGTTNGSNVSFYTAATSLSAANNCSLN
jgi:phosphodiesterase/alkaline phosphatase D-like protein